MLFIKSVTPCLLLRERSGPGDAVLAWNHGEYSALAGDGFPDAFAQALHVSVLPASEEKTKGVLSFMQPGERRFVAS